MALKDSGWYTTYIFSAVLLNFGRRMLGGVCLHNQSLVACQRTMQWEPETRFRIGYREGMKGKKVSSRKAWLSALPTGSESQKRWSSEWCYRLNSTGDRGRSCCTIAFGQDLSRVERGVKSGAWCTWSMQKQISNLQSSWHEVVFSLIAEEDVHHDDGGAVFQKVCLSFVIMSLQLCSAAWGK